MAQDQIELRQLDHVVKICQAGSFSEAARRLGLSQPALSKSISKLESQLGVRLFQRNGGAATATNFGLMLAERGRGVLAGADSLRRDLSIMAGHPTQRLRIGVGPATRLRPLPSVIEGLLKRHPEINLEARIDDGVRIIRGVEQGRFDVAFGASENAESFGDLMRINIFQDRMTIVSRPGHPLAGAGHPLSPGEVLKFPMASVGITPSFARWITGLGASEMANANAFVSDDMELLQNCLPAHHVMRGVAFVFERALAAGELVELPVTWVAEYHCWMLTTADNWRLPVVKSAAEFARGAMPNRGSDHSK